MPSGSPMFCLFEKINTCRIAFVAWAWNTFDNSKMKLQDTHRVLEELVSQNNPYNLGGIKKLKEEIDDCFSRMSYIGKNGHVPLGCQLGTRIHNFSIKEQVEDDGKITYLVFFTIMRCILH